jgi:nitrous oxide reductase accessory protein NosL
MSHRSGFFAVLVATLALSLASCGPSEDAGRSISLEPLPIDDQEGAVCGMLVRDQSAPRAQVIHAGGERSFLCSIGDLLAYLEVPSPSGEPLLVLVEVMEPGEDPLASHAEPHPWLRADAAAFVLGIPRRGIMGEPVLVYADVAIAEQVIARQAPAELPAAGSAARVVDFAELKRWWATRDKELAR